MELSLMHLTLDNRALSRVVHVDARCPPHIRPFHTVGFASADSINCGLQTVFSNSQSQIPHMGRAN